MSIIFCTKRQKYIDTDNDNEDVDEDFECIFTNPLNLKNN
jgi:hypothetical protein